MPFDIIENESVEHWVETKEALWLTADRERLVPEGDPEAAFLFASAGKRVSREDAERYGLVGKRGRKAEAPAEKPDDVDTAERTTPKRSSAKRRTAKRGTAKRASSKRSTAKRGGAAGK